MIRFKLDEGKASTRTLPTGTSVGELPGCPICRTGRLFLRGHTVVCSVDGEIGRVDDPRAVALWHEPQSFRLALDQIGSALHATFNGVTVSHPDRQFAYRGIGHEASAELPGEGKITVGYRQGAVDQYDHSSTAVEYDRLQADARGQAPWHDKHHDPDYVVPDGIHEAALALSAQGFRVGGGCIRCNGLYCLGMVRNRDGLLVEIELGWPVPVSRLVVVPV